MSAPFGNITGTPLGLVDWRNLSEAEIGALRAIGAGGVMKRGGGCYQDRRSGRRVTLFYAQMLEGKGLARVDNDHLVLTGSGRWTLQLADEAATDGGLL